MLGAILVVLCLLPAHVYGLYNVDAKCLSGYNWVFNSAGQSPCDLEAELVSVCAGSNMNLGPLPTGFVYLGPTKENQNPCVCSSVVYSLLSACAYCQGENYLKWSIFSTNCTTAVYVTVFNQELPDGVKVPAYAYQDVRIGDQFNVTLAENTKGGEATRAPSGSTLLLSATTSAGSQPTTPSKPNNTPAIIGGVVGGVLSLGLIAALILWLVIRSRHRPDTIDDQNTRASFVGSSMLSPGPDSPGKFSNNINQGRVQSLDGHTSMYQNPIMMNQVVPSQNTGQTGHYTGRPEL